LRQQIYSALEYKKAGNTGRKIFALHKLFANNQRISGNSFFLVCSNEIIRSDVKVIYSP